MAILKIVQLITRMDKIGGAQKHVEALAIQLKQDGHEVTVVTGSYQPSLWRLQEEKNYGYPYSRYATCNSSSKGFPHILAIKSRYQTFTP
ncbi:hypothetical protein OL548_32040 [Lysinibacillus sp. MHQ-1]|nr:hypothetical protein OL548_32040 [Lysinibacillus sp. MHQ-1]